MEKEAISRLFQLLIERQKNKELSYLEVKRIRKCQEVNEILCIFHEHDICHDCVHRERISYFDRVIANINEEIAELVDLNALELAKELNATAGECAEWLHTMNEAHRKLTGENNSLYTAFAKELGVKL